MNSAMTFTWGNEFVKSHLGFPIHLSERQREVLLLLCEGLPNKLIGRRLDISDATVKCHVASVLRSLNVSTRLEAVAVAHKLGLVRTADVVRAGAQSTVLPGRGSLHAGAAIA